MSVDSTKKTIQVAVGVCLVCSVLVSTAAVGLNSIQKENKRLDKIKNILVAGNLYKKNSNIAETFKKRIDAEIVDLNKGLPIQENEYNETLNKESFDLRSVAADPEYSRTIPSGKDIAQIKRMPEYIAVYKVMKDDEMDELILPIYGKGLWSTMYGFLALDKDLKTVRGITFYDHGETPGLGGEIENPRWQNIWKGKKAFDENWNVALEVIKGTVDQSNPNAEHMIDGLSGATLTTRGVDNTIKFWLGNEGYGKYLKNLRGEKLNAKI